MITRESLINLGKHYSVRFAVYDDKEWFVTINNDEDEYGASSNECHLNWNKGLAEAFMNIASMMSLEEAGYLMSDLAMCKHIDNGFRAYLPEPYGCSCFGCQYYYDCDSTPSTCMGD